MTVSTRSDPTWGDVIARHLGDGWHQVDERPGDVITLHDAHHFMQLELARRDDGVVTAQAHVADSTQPPPLVIRPALPPDLADTIHRDVLPAFTRTPAFQAARIIASAVDGGTPLIKDRYDYSEVAWSGGSALVYRSEDEDAVEAALMLTLPLGNAVRALPLLVAPSATHHKLTDGVAGRLTAAVPGLAEVDDGGLGPVPEHATVSDRQTILGDGHGVRVIVAPGALDVPTTTVRVEANHLPIDTAVRVLRIAQDNGAPSPFAG